MYNANVKLITKIRQVRAVDRSTATHYVQRVLSNEGLALQYFCVEFFSLRLATLFSCDLLGSDVKLSSVRRRNIIEKLFSSKNKLTTVKKLISFLKIKELRWSLTEHK